MIENQGQPLISWMALEFSPVRRSPSWYILALLVGIAVCIWTIWAKQWFTLAVVIMLAIVIGLLQKVQPRQFSHSLTDQGVLIGTRFISYSKLKSFWIANTETGPVLNFIPNRKVGLAITLQLGTADVEKVREILASRLPEEEGRPEDMVDRISRYFKL